MKQTRKSVFETNSSSSHSLTLGKGVLAKQPFSKEILRSGVVSVAVGEFGWEWFRMYSPFNKLQYLLTQITDGSITAGNLDTLTEQDPNFAMLRDAVRQHTGCTLLPMLSDGYIDHQSARGEDSNAMEIFKDLETLKTFIFDETAYIQTGNDNDTAPWRINTDTGSSEFVYKASFAEVPKNYVQITLTQASMPFEDGLITVEGAALTNDFHPELLVAVQELAIISKAHLACGGRFNNAEYYPGESLRTRVVSQLVSTEQGIGPFKICSDIEVSTDYQKTRSDQYLVLTAWVPADLAAQLQALPATPAILRELSRAISQHEMHSDSVGQTWHDPLQYARLDKAVTVLQAKAIRKGLL